MKYAASHRAATSTGPGIGLPTKPTTEWLDSPYLRRVAVRVAHQYGLQTEEVSDLLQETRIAIWKAGPATCVTAAWIFGTASHKAADLLRMRIRRQTQERKAFGSLLPPLSTNSELEHLLHARADLLPGRLRGFYRLKYELGLSEREIASRWGICRASVRWLERCCRRALRFSR